MFDHCEPASHVFIAIPTRSFHPSAATFISIARAIDILRDNHISWTLRFESLNGYIDDARNILATMFRMSPATDLLFVDDDIGFHEEDILKILLSDRPVVGGTYRKKCSEEKYAVGFLSDEVAIQDDGAIEVDYLPTGFMRINRAVLESMPVETYQHIDGSILFDHFIASRQVYRGKRSHVTEDVDFCRRWRSLGGKVYLIPDMTFDHIGIQSFSGNWASWQAEQDRK